MKVMAIPLSPPAKEGSYQKVPHWSLFNAHIKIHMHINSLINLLGKGAKKRVTTAELLEEKFRSKAALKEKELDMKKHEKKGS